MKLANELTLELPLAQTWPALLDVPRVGQALPGATLEPAPVEDGFRGAMKVKLGPVSAEYTGLARLEEVDEDEHRATYHVHGREIHGQGEAQATIRISAAEQGSATRLHVETELQVSGRQAQLGRGLMEDVAAGVLDEFAARLQRALTDPGAGPHATDEPFDASRAVLRPLIERGAFALTGLLVGFVLGRLRWRR